MILSFTHNCISISKSANNNNSKWNFNFSCFDSVFYLCLHLHVFWTQGSSAACFWFQVAKNFQNVSKIILGCKLTILSRHKINGYNKEVSDWVIALFWYDSCTRYTHWSMVGGKWTIVTLQKLACQVVACFHAELWLAYEALLGYTHALYIHIVSQQ